MAGSFFDSNILLYIASNDAMKAERAEKLLSDGGATSVQVLNEIANVSRRKMRMTWPDTHSFLSTLRSLLSVHAITVETHETGLALAEAHRLSIYDAMIAASALQTGCNILWSEDMQHARVIDKRLRIINPFRA
jgi:predicted nucleic acid-binding protein